MIPMWFLIHSLRGYVPKPCPFFLISCVLTTFSTNGGKKELSGGTEREELPGTVQLVSIYKDLCKMITLLFSITSVKSLVLLFIYLLRNILLSGYFSCVSGCAAKQNYYTLCKNLRSTQFLPRKIITFCIKIGIWGLG